MDDGLKQRIVGAVVLLALLVIFLPVLFDRNRVVPVDQTTQIPPAPSIVAAPIGAPVAPEVMESDVAPEPSQMFTPQETKASKNPEPEAPKLNAKGAPVTWVLQVASYKSADMGRKFRDELAGKGYSAFMRDIKTPKGVSTRVYVGPKLDNKNLLEAKRQLDEAYKLNTTLMEFTPP